jgi:periplasmic divalent cation tolerance protein
LSNERRCLCGLSFCRSSLRELRREEEVNVLIKTDDHLYSVVEERLKELHPYEIPLIFALQAEYTSAEYAAWVNLQTGVL